MFFGGYQLGSAETVRRPSAVGPLLWTHDFEKQLLHITSSITIYILDIFQQLHLCVHLHPYLYLRLS